MHDKSRKAMNFSQFFSNFLNLPSGTGQIRRSFTNLGFLPLGSTLPGITARLRASLTGRVRPSGLLQVDNCWRNPQEHRPRNEPADGRKDSAIGTFAAARTEANQFRSSDSSFPNRNRVVAGELVEGEAGNHFDSVHLHQLNQSGLMYAVGNSPSYENPDACIKIRCHRTVHLLAPCRRAVCVSLCGPGPADPSCFCAYPFFHPLPAGESIGEDAPATGVCRRHFDGACRDSAGRCRVLRNSPNRGGIDHGSRCATEHRSENQFAARRHAQQPYVNGKHDRRSDA